MTATTHIQTHFAEFNLGRLLHDWDDPRVAEFVEGLPVVYAIAERSPGFVWMMPPEEMEAAQLDPAGVFGGDPRIASTLSVWESVESLRAFVFATLHGRFLSRGGQWFERRRGPALVLWPVVPGHRPTISEAAARLRLLEERGASADAFDWAWATADGAGERKNERDRNERR